MANIKRETMRKIKTTNYPLTTALLSIILILMIKLCTFHIQSAQHEHYVSSEKNVFMKNEILKKGE